MDKTITQNELKDEILNFHEFAVAKQEAYINTKKVSWHIDMILDYVNNYSITFSEKQEND